jgi:hypothetical protein
VIKSGNLGTSVVLESSKRNRALKFEKEEKEWKLFFHPLVIRGALL